MRHPGETPAQLELSGGTTVPYDAAQRAYVLPLTEARTMRMTLHASATSPAVHPAFVVPGWRGSAEMLVIAVPTLRCKPAIGHLDELDGSRVVIYLPVTATGDVVLELRAK